MLGKILFDIVISVVANGISEALPPLIKYLFIVSKKGVRRLGRILRSKLARF